MLNLVAFIPLEGSIIQKLNQAEQTRDGFILFFRRTGNYVDRSKFKGIEYDRKVQMEYIEAIAKSYTLTADAVLLYSEIFPQGITQEENALLLKEEFPNVYSDEYENGEKNFIFNSFMNGGLDAVKTYITNRLNNRQLLTTTTVHGGYKPCFGSGNSYSTDYNKIAITGNIEFSAYRDEYTININGSYDHLLLDNNSVNMYFIKTTGKNAPRSTSIGLFGIFFLTKINNSTPFTYKVDDVIQYSYYDLPESDSKELDIWIQNNRDK